MTEDEIRNAKFLQEEYEKNFKLITDTYDTIDNLRIDNLKQKRDYLKHISLIIGAILAFIAAFYPFFIIKSYLYIGLSLNVFNLIFITSYLGSILDFESNGLVKQHDYFTLMFFNRLEIINEYLKNGKFKDTDMAEYRDKIYLSKDSKSINEEFGGMKKKSEERSSEALEYITEIVICLFILASAFLALSAINIHLSIPKILILCFTVIIISFFNWAPLFSRVISKHADLVRKYIERNKNKKT